VVFLIGKAFLREGFENQKATVRRTVACEGLTEQNIYFCYRQKCNKSLSLRQEDHPTGWSFLFGTDVGGMITLDEIIY